MNTDNRRGPPGPETREELVQYAMKCERPAEVMVGILMAVNYTKDRYGIKRAI